MGLLDELENEAQKRRSDEEEAAARKVERETTYRTVTEPAMTALFAWLREFTTKLKELQPRLRIAHTLPGYGEVAGYVEHEYDLREARQPSSREITLSFGCVVAPSECPNVQVEGANRVRAISALFQRYRLGGPLAPQKDASGETTSATFKAKGRIPLEASFQSDTGSGQLRIAFTNFEDFGAAVKLFPPERLDEAFFDEIGRYLLREPNSLMREALPDDFRNALKARVQEQEVRRRWESQIAARQVEEIAMLKREYSVAGKFSRLGDAVGKLRGLVGRKG